MRTRSFLLAGLAAVALAAASVTAIAVATSVRLPTAASGGPGQGSTACRPASLTGTQVTVVLSDMGAMMNGGMMGGRMMLRLAPQTVPAGTVSFIALNHGTVTHELVVLPLAPGASAGTRTVGADNRVSEDGSVGEASKECGAGAGEGIAPGDASWVTLALQPGRYELACNLSGHYAAGMYGELDVT
jgi:uncharacterized cupredoxin-like copper-binding protein